MPEITIEEIRERVNDDYRTIPQPDHSVMLQDLKALLHRLDSKTPLCSIHQGLEDRGTLEIEISGMDCIACSLNERADLLKMLAPFAAPNGAKDSLQVMRDLITRATSDGDITRCAYCGSSDIDDISGEYETGVVAPDGYRERRYENGFNCRKCGRDQEYH